VRLVPISKRITVLSTFGTLKTAQVLGDFQALLNVDRTVIRFDMGTNLTENIKKLGEVF